MIYTVCTCFNDNWYSYIPLSLKFINIMLDSKFWLILKINDEFLEHPLAELVYNRHCLYFFEAEKNFARYRVNEAFKTSRHKRVEC